MTALRDSLYLVIPKTTSLEQKQPFKVCSFSMMSWVCQQKLQKW